MALPFAHVGARIGHRVRWIAVWTALALWFVSIMLGLGGNAVHLLLVVVIVVLLYELLAAEPRG